MIATLITEKNEDSFLSAVSADIQKKADLLIGAVDEETDTACGLLMAEADSGHSLTIRFIYVEPEWRNRGAGYEMVRFLEEVAEELGVSEINCTQTKLFNDESSADVDLISALLYDCGFYDISTEDCIYSVNVSDLIESEHTENKGGIEKNPHNELSYTKARHKICHLSKISKKKWQSVVKDYYEYMTPNDGRDPYEIGSRDQYDADLSIFSFDEEGNCTGVLLVQSDEDKSLLSEYRAMNRDLLSAITTEAISAVRYISLPDDTVYMSIISDNSRDLFSNITGGKGRKVGEILRQSYEVSTI